MLYTGCPEAKLYVLIDYQIARKKVVSSSRDGTYFKAQYVPLFQS